MTTEESKKALLSIGEKIDAVDRQLVHLLARRLRLSQQVAMVKLEAGEPLVNLPREKHRLEKVAGLAQAENLNPEFAHALLYMIIDESCKAQIELMDDLRLMGRSEKYRPTPDELREGLLKLTALVADSYDAKYGESCSATKALAELEEGIIDVLIKNTPDRGLALDLGCATGRESLRVAHKFKKLVGYDISEHMVSVAQANASAKGISNVRFECLDVEKGLPVESESVSLVIMNEGTGSDMFEPQKLLSEIQRVLKTGGSFMVSFYNKNAWTQQMFMPWPLGLAASVNQDRGCLEVATEKGPVAIHAKLYTTEEVREMMPLRLAVSSISTYPALSSVLPKEVIDGIGLDAIKDLDSTISAAALDLGAYIVVTGRKE